MKTIIRENNKISEREMLESDLFLNLKHSKNQRTYIDNAHLAEVMIEVFEEADLRDIISIIQSDLYIRNKNYE